MSKCQRCGGAAVPEHKGLCCSCSDIVANDIILDARVSEEMAMAWAKTLRLAIQRTITYRSIRGLIRRRLEEAVNSGEVIP